MITGDIKNEVDRIWDSFWSGGISNPLEVIEQVTCLLFIRRLDDLHTLEENKPARPRRPMERRVFADGTDNRGRAVRGLPWAASSTSRRPRCSPSASMSPFYGADLPRQLGSADSTYAHHKGRALTIPTPALLVRVVDMLDHVPMEDRDTKETSTSTCSAESQPLGRTASSARRATSSGSWSRLMKVFDAVRASAMAA